MAKGRDDSAERMSDLFALLRTRRQSGLLSVERYENGRFEEGEVTFQKGQPVDAQTGNRTGQNAISYLLVWRRVDFSFTPETMLPPPITPSRLPNPPTPIPPTPAERPINSTGPLSPLRQRTPLPDTNLPQLSSSAQQATNKSAFFERIPRKLANEQNVMDMALTRPQRSLYLLIDGRRTVADLIRVTHRDEQEVYHLLTELQARGLIL